MNSFEKTRIYFEKLNEIEQTHIGAEAKRHADALNSKSSALLGHVSIMTAISSGFLFWANSQSKHFDFLERSLLLEIIGYLLICMLCVRTVWITGFRSFSKPGADPEKTFIGIVMSRRRTYFVAITATMVVTVLFIGTLLLKLAAA